MEVLRGAQQQLLLKQKGLDFDQVFLQGPAQKGSKASGDDAGTAGHKSRLITRLVRKHGIKKLVVWEDSNMSHFAATAKKLGIEFEARDVDESHPPAECSQGEVEQMDPKAAKKGLRARKPKKSKTEAAGRSRLARLAEDLRASAARLLHEALKAPADYSSLARAADDAGPRRSWWENPEALDAMDRQHLEKHRQRRNFQVGINHDFQVPLSDLLDRRVRMGNRLRSPTRDLDNDAVDDLAPYRKQLLRWAQGKGGAYTYKVRDRQGKLVDMEERFPILRTGPAGEEHGYGQIYLNVGEAGSKPGDVEVGEGNHRLAALKQLHRAGLIPADVKVPVSITYVGDLHLKPGSWVPRSVR